jgi:SAM-dependent methyltransferase
VSRWRDGIVPGRGTFLDTIRYADNYTHAAFTAQALESKSRVLVIGDAGGRDSLYLEHLGHKVAQLDLSPQDGVPDLVVQSIEDRTPFDNGEFDGIVLNEVLEHLHRDLDALNELYRILSPSGLLVVSVPASQRQDRPEFHVRIHTARTLTRLLSAAGFVPVDQYDRGIIARLSQTSLGRAAELLAQMAFVWAGATPEEAVKRVNAPLARLEMAIGAHPILQRPWITRGFHVVARLGEKGDMTRTQIDAFAHTNRLRYHPPVG